MSNEICFNKEQLTFFLHNQILHFYLKKKFNRKFIGKIFFSKKKLNLKQ